MYYLEEMVSKVVTIKTTNGLEIITRLLAYDEASDLLTLGEPRVIVINDEGEMALIPYAYTADTAMVMVHSRHVFTVLETSLVTMEDYVRIVQSAKEEINTDSDEITVEETSEE